MKTGGDVAGEGVEIFWLPALWSSMLVEAPLKFTGVDLKTNYGQSVPPEDSFWSRVERFRVPGRSVARESFCRVNQHEDSSIIAAFGTRTPDSTSFLLHQAPVDAVCRPCPVLFVHGAALNAHSWSVEYGQSEGMARRMAFQGFRVFAVTFSHSHGNNIFQARQLACAVELVREKTGCTEIDLVCHSKGGIACRCWLQGLAGVPYTGGIRRICMLGVPNLGTDQVFRHPTLSFFSHMMGISSVIAYDKMWSMGMVIDTREQSVYADGAFRGQAQMLHRWDAKFPLDLLELDAEVAYRGGWGTMGHSRGIDRAIEDGGHLIMRLDRAPFPSGVQVALLAGNKHCFGTIPAEAGASSDGLVFTASALHAAPFVSGGAELIAFDVLHINHLEMLYDSRAAEWVERCLA